MGSTLSKALGDCCPIFRKKDTTTSDVESPRENAETDDTRTNINTDVERSKTKTEAELTRPISDNRLWKPTISESASVKYTVNPEKYNAGQRGICRENVTSRIEDILNKDKRFSFESWIPNSTVFPLPLPSNYIYNRGTVNSWSRHLASDSKDGVHFPTEYRPRPNIDAATLYDKPNVEALFLKKPRQTRVGNIGMVLATHSDRPRAARGNRTVEQDPRFMVSTKSKQPNDEVTCNTDVSEPDDDTEFRRHGH